MRRTEHKRGSTESDCATGAGLDFASAVLSVTIPGEGTDVGQTTRPRGLERGLLGGGALPNVFREDVMATIAIQREPEAKPLAPLARDWDPFRSMREILRWDPFAELRPRVLEEAGFTAAFEVKETKDAFLFKGDLPGLKAEDLDVKITQNRLTVSGKREAEKTEKGDTFYAYERSYGSFVRSFTLPEGVDSTKIEAALENGVLSVTLPKKPEVKPRQVDIKAK